MGVGASFLYVPVYLTEISPSPVRGSIVMQHQVSLISLEITAALATKHQPESEQG